ncbi:hypothetical protein GZ77_03280 [Endozoicomonas montiporae]|uniref:Uncharacterized protein n=2 Tax=Endozoicomonas montiporae TaxID=1027273 RepID=A0A081NB07_9GAMM|nr:hypothetical protein [Endozoicomonas montiporae]AMO56668.1 hypothetical protein EZMO1_2596 [Endozoicomonas montiporae CL-33]KEQ15630.1 hypothetical protein GZ77_03280 [Endozoicomonas montiporae]
MKRLHKSFSALVLSVALVSSVPSHTANAVSLSEKQKVPLLVMTVGFAGFVMGNILGVGLVARYYQYIYSKNETTHEPVTGQAQATMASTQSTILPTLPTLDDDQYQEKLIKDFQLISFELSEDNYADTENGKHTLQYLWARGTLFENKRPYHLFNNTIQPALFPVPVTTGDYKSPYGYLADGKTCESELPDPYAKALRCNDEQLTGYCRIKYRLGSEANTLIGMLANTSDHVRGCLLPDRQADYYLEGKADKGKVPRGILVTKPEYFQVNVMNGKISYILKDKLNRHRSMFASSSLFPDSGKRSHEILCKFKSGVPGIEWRTDNGQVHGQGCIGLTTSWDIAEPSSYYVPYHGRVRGSKSAVDWGETAITQSDSVNQKVQDSFCSPRKPFKEFLLGSQGGRHGAQPFCRYPSTENKSSFVAKKPDGSVASDFLVPNIKASIYWEKFNGILPDKAVVAGLMYVSSNTIKQEPVYFCRFESDEHGYPYIYGQHFSGTDTCHSPLATPCDQSYAIVSAKAFDILAEQ